MSIREPSALHHRPIVTLMPSNIYRDWLLIRLDPKVWTLRAEWFALDSNFSINNGRQMARAQATISQGLYPFILSLINPPSDGNRSVAVS